MSNAANDNATATSTHIDRDVAVKLIRASLRKRSGKAWSVTVGTGTAWGWIDISAPPARRTWHHVHDGVTELSKARAGEGYVWRDTGETGGHMSPADCAELAALLGLDKPVHFQGESVSPQERALIVARAAG